MIDLDRALSAAVRAADAARAVILKGYASEIAHELKGDRSPVTVVDRQSELAIREVLSAEFPSHAILGEEFGETAASSEYRWIIDPLDGTISFLNRIPTVSTLICLCRGAQPLVGVIEVPALRRRITAVAGRGAWEDGKRLRVGQGFDPMDSVVCHGDRYTFTMGGYEAFYRAVDEQCRLFRSYTDAYGHFLVATGSADLVVDSALERWDLAASALVLREAGAKVALFPDRNAAERRFMIAGTEAAVDWAVRFLGDEAPSLDTGDIAIP